MKYFLVAPYMSKSLAISTMTLPTLIPILAQLFSKNDSFLWIEKCCGAKGTKIMAIVRKILLILIWSGAIVCLLICLQGTGFSSNKKYACECTRILSKHDKLAHFRVLSRTCLLVITSNANKQKNPRKKLHLRNCDCHQKWQPGPLSNGNYSAQR